MASLQRDINADTISTGKALVIPHKSLSSPASIPGTVAYDPAGKAVIYCDGTAWFLIGGTSVPITTTDNAIARFNGTAGTVQNSGVVIDDGNNLTTSGAIQTTSISFDSGTNTMANYLATAPWTPTMVPANNLVDPPAVIYASYERIGGVIFWHMSVNVVPTLDATLTQFTFTLPVTLPGEPRSLLVGSLLDNTSTTPNGILSSQNGQNVSVGTAKFNSNGIIAESIFLSGSYLIN